MAQSPSPSSPNCAGGLPVGFRFWPTDRELVELFLINKVLGRPLPFHHIKEGIDIYLHDPVELPIDISYTSEAYGSEAWAYFFVISDRGVGSDRRTPGGYWKVAGGQEEVVGNGGRTVGFKRSLVFYRGNAPDGVETKWLMEEYRLNLELDEFTNSDDCTIKNCFVYRIYTKISKACQVEEEENSKEDQSIKSTKMMKRKRKVIQGSLDECEIRKSRFGSS